MTTAVVTAIKGTAIPQPNHILRVDIRSGHCTKRLHRVGVLVFGTGVPKRRGVVVIFACRANREISSGGIPAAKRASSHSGCGGIGPRAC